MLRRHHQGLSTVGSTAEASIGQGPAVEEPDVHPDVWRAPKRCRSPTGGHPPDGSLPSLDPDVGGPKRHRLSAQSAPDPDVGGAPKHHPGPPAPDVGTQVGLVHPLKRSPDPQKVGGADVQHLAVSDADVAAPLHLEVSSDPDVAVKRPTPDVEGAKNEGRVLVVDSDTDVEEEEELHPDVACPKLHRRAPTVLRAPGREVEAPHPDVGAPQNGHGALEDSDTDVELESPKPAVGSPHNGHQLLVVDSDTDVEEDRAQPDVGPLESPKPAPRDPEVKAEPPNRAAGGRPALLVESDTDAEEATSDPEVWPPKPPRNIPRNPDVRLENPNPGGQGPQPKLLRLLVDSDTDVEEEEAASPDVGRAKSQRLARQEQVLVMETPKPDVEEPQREGWKLGVASDTDGEDEELSQRGLHPRAPRKHPVVVMESPNPDVGGLSPGDSDTDVEEGSGGVPDVGTQPGGQGAAAEPDVVAVPPNPAVPPSLESSNTDVGEVAPAPDVRGLQSHIRFRPSPHPDVVGSGAETAPNSWKTAPNSRSNGGVVPKRDDLTPDPDVGAAKPDVGALNPDVKTPNPDWGSPNPDVATLNPDVKSPSPDVKALNPAAETLNPDVKAPSPDVKAPNPAAETLNPDVKAPRPDMVAPSLDVETPNPDWGSPNPDVEPLNPDAKAPNLNMSVLNPDMVAPYPDVEPPHPHVVAPNPDVEAQGHDMKTLVQVPAVPMDASTPKSQHLDPHLDGTGGADVTEGDSDEDLDLFLEPTQSFLPPADKGSPPGWDPEEPTQLFCPPREEEEEEEEPPQDPPQATIIPPTEGTKEEGPRRSQRLARSRRGGAKGGVASEVGGAPPGPAPLRRSPRLRARPLAPPEPRPPPAKPRPPRAGTSLAGRHAQEEEEEPTEVEVPQLRPRRSRGSTPPKVLFTGVVASKAMEVALRTLGGSMATSVFDCTHLVTDRVRRTVKFLCALARGVPIVTPEWLHKSASSGHVLATGPFLVQDQQQEHHFGFSLAQALQRARRHPLLQGYEIHVTPSVRPEPEHMKDIITCSGGTFLPTMPSTYRPRRVVVSCAADAWCWGPALSSRLPLASAELLLTGLLRQRLQLQPFLLLPPDPPTRARSHRDPPSTRRRPVGPPQ
ncbi:mediator of DNA damage checkpoint protein 1 [Strigops habroptila]|uniref:mediator of DNA damage checkpoint protein 1 n=1 Tax=Strigops habroptila TaxID=2489341 RepID=UPI0011CF736F|nr:mediator of DNA damage checkpoint protein 1 [Strigops habroptila]